VCHESAHDAHVDGSTTCRSTLGARWADVRIIVSRSAPDEALAVPRAKLGLSNPELGRADGIAQLDSPASVPGPAQ